MLENVTEVLIVGAGPVGLMMACQLTMQHVRFRIIDKSPGFANYSGALIVHAGTLELFSQLGISESIIEKGTILKAINFSFRGRMTGRLDISHIGSKQSEFPYALLIEQGKTERALATFLQNHGITIERETELTDFSEFSDHIECYLANSHDEEKLITGFLIAADGGHSYVRSKLEIPLTGTTHSRSLFAMDCMASLDIPSNEALIAFTSQATAGFFPLHQGKWRIDGAFRWREKNPAITFRHVQLNFKRKTLHNFNISSASWFSLFQSHRKSAVFFNTERCFLIGDAAHLYSPVGAQGMNQGMQDAANLSWKLAYTIKKWANPCVLYTYEAERKQIALKTARSSDRLFDFLSSDKFLLVGLRIYLLPLLFPILKHIFKKPVIKQYLFRNISGVGITYKNSPLTMPGAFAGKGPQPGERIPYGIFTRHGKAINIKDDIKLSCMQLYVFCREKKPDDFLEKTEKFKMQVEWHIIDYGPSTRVLFNRLKVKKTTFYLVRPDMYIACKGRSPEMLEKYLYWILIPDSI